MEPIPLLSLSFILLIVSIIKRLFPTAATFLKSLFKRRFYFLFLFFGFFWGGGISCINYHKEQKTHASWPVSQTQTLTSLPLSLFLPWRVSRQVSKNNIFHQISALSNKRLVRYFGSPPVSPPAARQTCGESRSGNYDAPVEMPLHSRALTQSSLLVSTQREN